MFNAAIKDSKSHEHGAEALLEEIDRVEELINDYKHIISGCVSGNHDQRVFKTTGEDSLRRICKNAKIAYQPNALVLVFKFGKNGNGDRLVYSIFLTHTLRGGRKEGTKLQKVVDLRDVIDCDAYLAGHSHDLSTHKGTIIKVDTRNGSLSLKQRVFGNCGSEFGYIGYPVAQNYAPSKRGVVRLRLDGRKHDLHMSI